MEIQYQINTTIILWKVTDIIFVLCPSLDLVDCDYISLVLYIFLNL